MASTTTTGGAPAPRGDDVADYVDVARRRWRWVALGLLVGLAAALVVALALPRPYVARTSVLVEPTGVALSGGTRSTTVNLDTEAQVVRSSEVEQRAADLLGDAAPAELAGAVDVTVPANSQVLVIAFEAADPDAAAAGARAYAQAYLDNRTAQVADVVESSVEAIEEDVAELDGQLTSASRDVEQQPVDAASRVAADSRRTLLIRQIGDLTARAAQLREAAGAPGRVISDARVPDEPAGASTVELLGGGAGAGLVLGALLALVRERADPRLRTARGLGEEAGVPVLAVLPRPGGGDDAEALARLRNVLAARLDEPRPVLLLTGADERVPVGPVVHGLAGALAAAGRDVLVVDLLDGGPGSGRGLADLLAGDGGSLPAGREEVVGSGRLRVLGAGERPERLEGLLAAPSAAGVVAGLRQEGDLVLVAGPPAPRAASQDLAALADHVVPVVLLGSTRRDDLARSVEQAAEVGGSPLGLVVLEGSRRGRGHAGGSATAALPPAPAPAPAAATPAAPAGPGERAPRARSGDDADDRGVLPGRRHG